MKQEGQSGTAEPQLNELGECLGSVFLVQ